MPFIGKSEARPGFQGSETTTAICTVYQHGDDPIILTGEGEGSTKFSGKKSIDPVPSILSVQTQKAMGASSGNFVMTLKPSKAAESLFDSIVDDDWVDISFGRHGNSWHVFRGLIDEIRTSKTVGGTGATTEVMTVTGRDFGRIWEQTPVWFNPYASHEFVERATTRNIFNGLLQIAEDPGTVSMKFLRDFLEAIADDKGANWNPPPWMPGIVGGSIKESIIYSQKYYQDLPHRINFNLHSAVPQGMLWDLAKQYSDPMFTELYADVLPDGDPYSPRIQAGDPLDPSETKMTAVIRDKPFPIVYSGLEDYHSEWENLPIFEVHRQEITTADLGRSGFERFNIFFVAGLMTQENFPEHAITMLQPLYDGDSIRRHGMRRMDIQLSVRTNPKYSLDYTKMVRDMRYLLRDWYCMNPYFYSGSIELAHGRPDIKIGCRVRIPGAALSNNQEQPTETYYVETVNHVWQFGSGMRTILGVTRGWLGTDDSYMAALSTIADRYQLADLTGGME